MSYAANLVAEKLRASTHGYVWHWIARQKNKKPKAMQVDPYQRSNFVGTNGLRITVTYNKAVPMKNSMEQKSKQCQANGRK